MCVIAASPAGARQPTRDELRAMWDVNPHGAGVMWPQGGKVEIRKGFMEFEDFYEFVRKNRFGDDLPVVYHFRIATQGGINPAMCHPFPITARMENTRRLTVHAPIGVAHNGIIRITSDGDRQYSDTAKFVVQYLSELVRSPADLEDDDVLGEIYALGLSKFCFLTGTGRIVTVGHFDEVDGILLSNRHHLPWQSRLWD